MKRSLTKQERLRTRREIDRVFRDGTVASCRGMRLACAPNDLEYCRIVVIPARGHKNAVARNRSKRLGREAFRSLKDRVRPGFDVAIVCYPGTYHYADRKEQLEHLLSRVHALFKTSAS